MRSVTLVVKIVSAVGLIVCAAYAAQAPSPTRATSEGTCFVAGPYRNHDEAQAIVRELHRRGLAGEPVSRPTRGLYYRVELSHLASRTEADAAVKQLHRAGVHDVFVNAPPGSGSDPSISLGVFRNLSDALRRNAEVRKLGFYPLVRQQSLSVPLWYAQVPALTDVTTFAAVAGISPRLARCVEPLSS